MPVVWVAVGEDVKGVGEGGVRGFVGWEGVFLVEGDWGGVGF